MRLLECSGDGEFSLTDDFVDNIPPYAILSHSWGLVEVFFKDLMNSTGKNKAGYDKIRFCGKQAYRDGIQYFWVDTCCIDKSNYTELAEAINLLFRWYRDAIKCYVYLSDVLESTVDIHNNSHQLPWESAFRASRWFTRGWTLQELLAPTSVEFFSQQGKRLGDKRTLKRQIHEITRIPVAALEGAPLSQFGVDERLSWAENRQTTREEDKAYSLLGIFNIHLPLIYGEGRESAFKRLRTEINRDHKGQLALLREPLTYFPLKEFEVRILILSPGDREAEFTANIEVFNVQDSERPKYNALSYVWGHEPAIHPMVVDSKILLIRPNLFHALRRIRVRNDHFHLWVDSVCIDQSNDLEKTVQVRQMADIYRKAENVWIWLGEEDLTSQAAIEFIPQINRTDFQWNDLWWEQSEFTVLDHILGRL